MGKLQMLEEKALMERDEAPEEVDRKAALLPPVLQTRKMRLRG